MHWLSPLNFQQRQRDVLAQRLAGTGEWILEADEFKRWKDGPGGGVLWCPGFRESLIDACLLRSDDSHAIAGAGKTVLAYEGSYVSHPWEYTDLFTDPSSSIIYRIDPMQRASVFSSITRNKRHKRRSTLSPV